MNGRTQKRKLSCQVRVHCARWKLTVQSSQPLRSRRTQAEAGYTRCIDRTNRGPIPSKTNLPGTRRSGAYKRERNSLGARKLRTENPFATQRPGVQFPIVDRQWIPQDTAFGTQEPNSPFEAGQVVLLTPSAFQNPTAEVKEPPASDPRRRAARNTTRLPTHPQRFRRKRVR